MKRNIIYLFSLVLLLCGCESQQAETPSLVVEGWIDANSYPTLLIHKSFVMNEKNYTSKTFIDIAEQQMLPFGKVTISDGNDEIVLTGRIDTLYMPPYIYNSINMVGQVGLTYTVTAKYRELYATATTTIPPIAHFDSIRVRTSRKGHKRLIGYVSNDTPNEQCYYLVFARAKGKKQFILCSLGVFDNMPEQEGSVEIYINNPLQDTREEYIDSYTFCDTCIYQVKLARIDEESYRFWQAYSLQDMTQSAFYVPMYRNIPGNVKGGIGNFTGMGSSIYTIPMNKDTVIVF